MTYTEADQRADTAFLVGVRYGKSVVRADIEAALAETPLAGCEWGCDDHIREAITEAAK